MRIIIFFVSAFLSFSAYCEDYYFQGEHHADRKFKTADLACKADGEKVSELQNKPLVGTSISLRSSGSYNCRVDMPDGFFRYTVVARRGDGCPDGAAFDEENGFCKEDPCKATIGQMTTHVHRLGDFSGAGVVNGRTDPPSKVCSNSCQYAWDYGGPTGAYRFVSGNPNGVFATFNYKGNGVSCNEGDSSVSAPGSKEATKEKDSKCTDKIEDSEGRVHYTCQASEVFKEPGSMNCGTVNGQMMCTAKKPSPKLDDKQVKTEVTEKTNPDGSKEKTTKTTTTVTSCTGANSCNTSTTTSTSTSKTNADGSSGGTSGTCTGPGCSGSSDDGSDTPEDEGEEEGEGPEIGKITKPTGEKGDLDLEGWDDKIDKARTDLSAKLESIKNEFSSSSLFGLNLGSGGGSLPCPSFEALGTTYGFCISDYGDNLSMIGDVLFMCCSLVAAFIVFAPRGS